MSNLRAERIEIIPLSAEQLRLWVNDIQSLEKQLDCHYEGEPVMGSFVDFIKGQAIAVENDPENYQYHTLWFIVRESDRVVMGEIAICGLPNENREVEVGYGLNPRFQGKGYMTEAVKAISQWALSQKNVEYVMAETNNNEKSENTLTAAGFTKYKQNEDSIWWRLSDKENH